MTTHTETMWAIAYKTANEGGQLYNRMSCSQKEAIYEYCRRYAVDHTSAGHKRFWETANKRSYFAVRVTITYEYPE